MRNDPNRNGLCWFQHTIRRSSFYGGHREFNLILVDGIHLFVVIDGLDTDFIDLNVNPISSGKCQQSCCIVS